MPKSLYHESKYLKDQTKFTPLRFIKIKSKCDKNTWKRVIIS